MLYIWGKYMGVFFGGGGRGGGKKDSKSEILVTKQPKFYQTDIPNNL